MDTPKVILVGNAFSGKTTACYKLLGNSTNANIPSTLGVGIYTYKAPSGNRYNLWDCAGKKKLGGFRDAYYLQANIACIFHGGEEYRSPQQWEEEVKRVAPNAQIFHIDGTFDEKYARIREILA
jgi:hypothetical protein